MATQQRQRSNVTKVAAQRQTLQNLRLGPLQRRAATEYAIEEAALDAALESSEPSVAIIELIVAQLTAVAEADSPIVAANLPDGTDATDCCPHCQCEALHQHENQH